MTLDDPRAGLPRAARSLAQIPTQGVVYPLPHACTAPGPEIMVDGLVGRKLFREQAPLAAAPQHVEDGIHHGPNVARLSFGAIAGAFPSKLLCRKHSF